MATADEKKRIVEDFLKRCNEYSDNMIRKYRKSLGSADAEQELALQGKITHWAAYRAFNEHAIMELKGTELDEWFDDD